MEVFSVHTCVMNQWTWGWSSVQCKQYRPCTLWNGATVQFFAIVVCLGIRAAVPSNDKREADLPNKARIIVICDWRLFWLAQQQQTYVHLTLWWPRHTVVNSYSCKKFVEEPSVLMFNKRKLCCFFLTVLSHDGDRWLHKSP